MLSCRRATAIASAGRDRPLAFRERWSLRAHVLICSSCRRALKQFKRIQALVEPADGIVDAALDAARTRRSAPSLTAEQRARLAESLPEHPPASDGPAE